MSELPDYAKWTVQNTEQAIALIHVQLKGLQARRAKTFVFVPDPSGMAAKEQRKQYALLMVDYGFVMGLVEMAHAAGYLDDNAYYSFKQDAHEMTMPGIVGTVGVQYGG